MPATPRMFSVIRSHGYGKREAISLPYVACLLEDQGPAPRYFTVPPDAPASQPGTARRASSFPGYDALSPDATRSGGLSFVFGGSED